MPLDLGFLDRVVNVHWGGRDVIVVFMEVSPFQPQPEYVLTPIGDKAELLDTWTTKSWSGDPAPFKNTAYKVKGSAGEFLTSTPPYCRS